jgi:hypothetical protein
VSTTACATDSFCAVLAANGLYTSTDPAGEASAWTKSAVNPPGPLLTCPSSGWSLLTAELALLIHRPGRRLISRLEHCEPKRDPAR